MYTTCCTLKIRNGIAWFKLKIWKLRWGGVGWVLVLEVRGKEKDIYLLCAQEGKELLKGP